MIEHTEFLKELFQLDNVKKLVHECYHEKVFPSGTLKADREQTMNIFGIFICSISVENYLKSELVETTDSERNFNV